MWEDIVHAVGANSADWCRRRRDAGDVSGTGPVAPPPTTTVRRQRPSDPTTRPARSPAAGRAAKAAQELILSAGVPDEDGVVQLADDKYFQAAVTGTGRVFTILSEFGDQGSGKLGNDPGPLHNEIPEPNRGPDQPIDNSTHWIADFAQEYYEDLFFGSGESFADFYTKQSSGNYTVAGSVSDWVQLPGNASTYGDNAVEDFGGTSHFIEDSGNAWFRRSSTRVARSTPSRPSWPRSTSGIATTTTTTAISMSRTATSTTSRRSTPVRARMPVAGPRAPMRSGHSARMPTRPTTWSPVQRSTARTSCSPARRSATPAIGSATSRSKPRTAALASLRTSSAMTSACRTCTTRTAAKTERPSGRSWPPVRG